jgi:hypothetical protein
VNPEFPFSDNLVWMRQRIGLVAKAAAAGLVQAPEDPDTIERLAEQKRREDALRVLRAIVEKHPDRMPRAFEIVTRSFTDVVGDRQGPYVAALREIVRTARARLPQLPRAQAAAIAWRTQSTSPQFASPQKADTAIDRDVAAIHKLVFLPKGGELYGREHWNAFDWPLTLRPFVIVNPDVPVKLADGTNMRVSMRDAAVENVLFLTPEQMAVFEQILNKLGGTRKRAARAIMETPNRPPHASTATGSRNQRSIFVQSSRNAIAGSLRVADRAGPRLARNDTASSAAGAPTMAKRS